MAELEVLVDQLGELLAQGVDDGSDALEIALLAGLADRLGADRAVMEPAEAWRDGPGADLLDEVWAEVDVDDLVDDIDACLDGQTDAEQVEEALFDFDDLVAAAVWCGRTAVVKAAALRVAQTIRMIPDPFATLGDIAGQMARSPAVAQHLDVYEYWMAAADAGRVSQVGEA